MATFKSIATFLQPGECLPQTLRRRTEGRTRLKRLEFDANLEYVCFHGGA